MIRGKKNTLTALLAMVLLSASLCGCNDKVSYTDVSDSYIKTLDYHDNFVILQLTDIHWNNATVIGNDYVGSKAYLKMVIDATQEKFGQIDLIEITGDTFCLTNSLAVNSFLDTMEEIGIPYAMIWGNHDRQSKYNPNWFSKKIASAPYSLYTEVDNDDVHGRSNYVIDLVKDGKTVWQVFNIDSSSSYREGATDIGLEYDYVRQDQIDWFDYMHKREGNDIPVLCYYHIPQKEFVEAYDAIMSGDPNYKTKFFKMEGISNSPYAVSLNPVFKDNNVKGAFIGHDHASDWTFTNPDGIVYGYGVKTTAELYSVRATEEYTEPDRLLNGEFDEEFDLNGATVVNILNTAGDFDLYHLYLSDKEETPVEMWEEY